MARNYAVLPHEYLEEMEMLSDEEFGRLCRALLNYSITGEEQQLPGPERVLQKRVYMQERRYQENYENLLTRNKGNGKRGGRPKNPDEPRETQINPDEPRETQINPDEPKETQKSQTKTETKTKTETNILSSNDEKNKCACARGSPSSFSVEEVSAVLADYLSRVNAAGSPRSLEELKGYAELMGPAVCRRAIDIALDEKKASWSYIRAILRRWLEGGVKCLADVERLDAQHQAGKSAAKSTGRKASAGPSPGDGATGDADRRAREDMERMRRVMGLDKGEPGGKGAGGP